MPAKKPEYRNNRSHTEFLQPMSHKYNHMDDIESEIIKCLGSEFDMEHLSHEDLQQETMRILGDRSIDELCRTKHVPLM